MTPSRELLTWLEPEQDAGTSGWFEPGSRFRVEDVEFRCATSAEPSTRGRFSIRKHRALVEEYLDLLDDFPSANVVELGVGDGGSVALAALVSDPGRLVAVELDPERIVPLDDLIDGLGMSERIRVHYGIDQADRTRLGAIVESEFGTEPLDLVIDDASHSLEETRTSFEVLFPRLRPGGLLLIEDWNHQHLLSRGIAEALAQPDQPGLAEFERRLAAGPPDAPLSRLVVELVLAQAESDEFLSRVTVGHRFVGARRGAGSLSRGEFRLSDLYTDHMGLLRG